MKIDKARCKKILTEVPISCKGLIHKLKTCSDSELVNVLKEITVWEYGKCELYHWIDVLDRFDGLLERVAKPDGADSHTLIYLCRKLEEKQAKHLVYYVLYFTALLMEHAYARHLYSSIEHLTNLLAASDMDIVLAVLNLLYVFSKRSNFISRLTPERRSSLKLRLNHLAESWGGKDNGFGLAACCEDKPMSEFPGTATTLHYEFYMAGANGASSHSVILLDKLDMYTESSARIMEELVSSYMVPTGKQMGLLTHIRLAQAFSNYARRLQCVQARLQAISILVYSNAGQDILQNLLYDGLIEELVDVLGVTDPRLTDIKAAALRTLTAIIHLERTPRINAIIDATGMSSYHGFFPSLFRSCVLSMIGESTDTPLPQTLSTALFSFLYHLASYESGGEALVSCGIMETLLRIVQWKSTDNSQLTFVTRAVRLVDLITNMDITTFTNFSGLSCLITRLEHEVNICRTNLGEEIVLTSPSLAMGDETPLVDVDAISKREQGMSGVTSVKLNSIDVEMKPEEGVSSDQQPESSNQLESSNQPEPQPGSSNQPSSSSGRPKDLKIKSLCIPQRAALLKSILNFLKKAIPDPLFSDYIRNVMDGSLPSSLKHIISKAEYYGPSLFLLATEVVTLYVFHEPSLLSSLQDRKLTDVILEALVVKEVPPTREVIASLPNILSALCLNQRGLEAFMKCKPFDRLFHVLLSPQYLPAMRRRSSDSLGDTATNLGTAMDELMRHQPTLRQDAMTAIIRLLKEVCAMGEDDNIIVQNMSPLGDSGEGTEEKGAGSDEDDDVLRPGTKMSEENSPVLPGSSGTVKQKLPLMEYIYNVVRFIDAILSNNATDDHCKEFVKQGGLEPLIKIPSLPNIVIQFASSRACMDVAITLKDILTLSQEGTVIVQCFRQIELLINDLSPLYNPTNESVLLNELARSPTPTQPFASFKTTPILHTITALESYTTLLISLCKVGQVDLRTVCISKWGCKDGLSIIDKLSKLFSAIVWENALLGLLGPPYHHTADRADLARLIEVLGPNPQIKTKTKDKKEKLPSHIKLLKPIWQAVDRLRKHLAAVLTVLCKLSCGHTRVRRTMGNKPIPSQHQCDMAKHITKFVVDGINWRPPTLPHIHSRVSLLSMIDHIGLAGQVLYSDSQQPYHLMLLEFDKIKGLQALVDSYEWSASMSKQDNNDLVLGSGEFMVAWLTLIRKLIDVKMITESTHSLPSPTIPQNNSTQSVCFEPIHFLAKSHKYAFEVISSLWTNLYTYSGMKTLKNEIGPITEHVIVILKHLLKGDLQDRLNKLDKKNEDGSSSSNSDSTIQPSEHLIQHLTDMGFATQHAIAALIHSNNNLTAATEYMLTRPNLSIPMPDSDMTEEEAMMQAIAMSLAVEGEAGEIEEEEKAPEEVQVPQEIEYVTEDKLWSLYDKILAGCIKLLEDVPSAVFKIGDLLAVVMEKKGDQSRSDTIARIVPLVVEGVKHVIECLNKSSYSAQVNNKRIVVLGAYIHCLLLISEDLMFSCGELFSETSLFNGHLLTLLRLYTDHLIKEGCQDGKPPGWLTPLILLFDVHEKMATMVKRRRSLPAVEHIWQYYEERHNRWVNYHSSSNTTIEKAYHAGEAEVCFNSGRRHYLVLFNVMTQINEENGAPRPVMRIPKPGVQALPGLQTWLTSQTPATEAAEEEEEPTEKGKEKKKTVEQMEVDEKPTVEHFTENETSEIVVLCTKILGHIHEADAVQALMRLLLRFTKVSKHSHLFAENNGLQHIMHLKETTTFAGFPSLCTLLFRHLLEDEKTLIATIESTILGHLAGTIVDDSTESRSGGNIKEIHNIMQKLAPVASRDQDIFSNGCQKLLRYTVPSTIKNLTDFSDLSNVLKGPYAIKASGEKATENSDISPLAQAAISALLGRLTVLHKTADTEGGDAKGDDATAKTNYAEEASSSETTRAPKKRRKTAHVEKEKKFLVTKSSILKMLSEAVKSYQGVAEYIIEQTVTNKEGETVSVLTYIMDNLLAPPPKDSPHATEDTHEYAKMILSTVAASNSSESAKEKLVDQLKLSLNTALNTVESPTKHSKIQALAALMSIILDSRSQYSTVPIMLDTFNNSLNSQSPPYISKLLIAKGLVSDLAQVPHRLDLSSPHMALTVNMCLKPLEVLTRLIYSSVLAEVPQSSDKNTEEADKEEERSVGLAGLAARLDDADIDTVVDQLLERAIPSSTGLTAGEGVRDEFQVGSLYSPTSPSSTPEERANPTSPRITTNNLLHEFTEGLNDAFNNGFETAQQSGRSPLFDRDRPEDDNDSFSDDDEDEGDDDEDDDDDDEDGDHGGETHDEEDENGVHDTVDDANVMEEDDGSEMDVDDDDLELDDTSNLVFEADRSDAFNLDFLNDEEEQFVTVMSNTRLNSARTHFRWSNPSPLARARARANGSTNSGLPTTHPLLIRNSDSAIETPSTNTRDTTQRLPRLLESDTTTPAFLHRLLGAGPTTADAVLLGTIRNTRTRVHVFDHTSYTGLRDEILNSDLNDINTSLGITSESVLSLPSALARWREEAHVLDGASLQDLVQLVKPPILATLQNYMDEEVAEIRETREKELKEEEEKKKKEEEERKAAAPPPSEPENSTPATEDNNPSPSDLGPLLTTSLNMACSHTGSESSMGGTDEGLPPLASTHDDSDSSLTSMSSMGCTPPQSNTGGEFLAMSPSSASVSIPETTNTPGASVPTEGVQPTESSSEAEQAVAQPDIAEPATRGPLPINIDPTFVIPDNDPVQPTIPPVQPDIVPQPVISATQPTSTTTQPDIVTQEAGSSSDVTTDPGINAIYIDGIPVPEGIDPSFLEALPDSIRMEVLLEQSAALARQRRVATQQQHQTGLQSTPGNLGVSPEFLAALPPHLVAEVLEQERIARPSTAEHGTGALNPSDVLMSLPSSLRQSVLADMEESQLNSLNEDLVQDYERIRSEQRARTVYTTIPSSYRAFNIGDASRTMGAHRSSIGPLYSSTIPPYSITGLNHHNTAGYKHEVKRSALLQEDVRKVVKKNPVEHDAITCLLVLLFIDDSLRLQTSRLHRVLRNLCCNTANRTWILISLLSIIQKCTPPENKSRVTSSKSLSHANNSWLSLSMNTSLGCKNNVFDITSSLKGALNSQDIVRIHPQASSVVCRRVLDLLVALGRYFPNHFLSKSVIDSGIKYGQPRDSKDRKVPQAELLSNGVALSDFWDYLLGSDQGKGKIPSGKSRKMADNSEFLSCPMGQLMVLLDHPVIKNNQTLIDRLLRLLSSIAHALAEQTSEKADLDSKNKSKETLAENCPENSIEKQHLQLVTNILTTGASSEEGLEDGTALLLQLSKVNSKLRDMTLSLMLAGLQSVAADLQQQIKQLLDELKEEHRKNPQKKKKPKETKTKAITLLPHKPSLKTPHKDLHLPAMSNLTKKNSSQAYFLRILKVVIAVRDVTIKSIQAEKEKIKKEQEAIEKEEKEKKDKEKKDKGEESEDDDEAEEEEEEKKKSEAEEEEDKTGGMGPLSEQLKVPQLWHTLGDCLAELGNSSDTHAVLILQPAVEAFFHVHGLDSTTDKNSRRRNWDTSASLDLLAESPAPLSIEALDSVGSFTSSGGLPINMSEVSLDTRKFITFAEKHKMVLNQILRQSTTPLSDGPFQVLVNHTRVLDFDVKRRYFRQELEKIEETNRREDIAIRVKREHVFEESFRELHRRSPEELKSRLYVIFEGEEGQDAGGLLREWYQIIAREIFNPHYALFTTTPGDKVTYVCNSFSHYNPNHLDYFKFVGRVIAKAIYDNKHLDCYFSRSFYKHILGQPVSFRDMEAEDYAFFKSMMFLLENDLEECGLDNLEFTMEIEEFGVTETRDLKPNGDSTRVTNANKKEYVKLLSQMKMTGSIRSQIKAFLDGFYDIIPRHLISIFTDTELELLISGLPTIDIDDLKSNTEYHKYQITSLQIQWFWRALRSFSQTERANFLQFVTGTSKVPLQGFASLEGMNGVQRFQIHRDDRSTDRLPSAHTCFNQLDLPVYETFDKLRRMLLLAINECPEGFGLA